MPDGSAEPPVSSCGATLPTICTFAYGTFGSGLIALLDELLRIVTSRQLVPSWSASRIEKKPLRQQSRKLFSIRMSWGVGAAPPGSFWRKTSKTSQLRNVLLRIVSPSAAHTCRHSTCALEPELSVKSWIVTPSSRMPVGDAVVDVPSDA